MPRSGRPSTAKVEYSNAIGPAIGCAFDFLGAFVGTDDLHAAGDGSAG
jgi:hypothetical protein